MRHLRIPLAVPILVLAIAPCAMADPIISLTGTNLAGRASLAVGAGWQAWAGPGEIRDTFFDNPS